MIQDNELPLGSDLDRTAAILRTRKAINLSAGIDTQKIASDATRAYWDARLAQDGFKLGGDAQMSPLAEQAALDLAIVETLALSRLEGLNIGRPWGEVILDACFVVLPILFPLSVVAWSRDVFGFSDDITFIGVPAAVLQAITIGLAFIAFAGVWFSTRDVRPKVDWRRRLLRHSGGPLIAGTILGLVGLLGFESSQKHADAAVDLVRTQARMTDLLVDSLQKRHRTGRFPAAPIEYGEYSFSGRSEPNLAVYECSLNGGSNRWLGEVTPTSGYLRLKRHNAKSTESLAVLLGELVEKRPGMIVLITDAGRRDLFLPTDSVPFPIGTRAIAIVDRTNTAVRLVKLSEAPMNHPGE